MEERSGDALYSAHGVFWVHRFLTFHHNVPVEVQLPLDRWVIRLQQQQRRVFVSASVLAYVLLQQKEAYFVLEVKVLTQVLLHLIIRVFL